MQRSVKMLVYGFSGSGKTTLLSTAPKPICIVDFEGGADWLFNGNSDVIVKSIVPQIKTIKRNDREFEISDSYSPLRRILNEIRQLEIRTLAFDGFSSYIRQREMEIVMFRTGGDYYPHRRLEYQDWYALQLEINNFVQQFLYFNDVQLIVFTCHRRINREKGTMFIPDIEPRKLAENIIGYMDVVAFQSSPAMDLDFEPHHLYLTVDESKIFFAKNRFGQPQVSEPNLTKLLEVWGVHERKTQPAVRNLQRDVEQPQKQRVQKKENKSPVDEMWVRVVNYAKNVGLTAEDAKEALRQVCEETGIDPSSLKDATKELLSEVEMMTMQLLADKAMEEQTMVNVEDYFGGEENA